MRNAFPVCKEDSNPIIGKFIFFFIMPMIDKIGILLQEMLEADLLIICLEER